MSCATRATVSIDDGMQIDRFLVELSALEHRPMAIDDLRGTDALGLNVGQDLADRVGRRPIRGVTIICSAWALSMIEPSG